MKLLTDITPLRETPAYRRLWIGTMLSTIGTAMTTYAVPLQAWTITHSTTAVGGLGAATLIPMLVIGMPGGILADRVDRRKLVLLVTVGQTAVSALLFTQALAGARSIWLLYVLQATSAGFSAIAAPARATFIPKLVPAGQLKPALALNRVIFQVAMIAGPGLAGLVTGAVGLKGCYLLDALSFAGGFYGAVRLAPMPPESTVSPENTTRIPGSRGKGLAATGQGLTYIWRNKVLAGTFLADVNATFFALPLSLFPAINQERFGGDVRILGLFTVAVGVGGMVTAAFSGPLRHVSPLGLAMLVAVSVWGAGFAVFAVAPSLWLTLLALAVAGAADTITVVIRGVIVQTVTPDGYRGRVNAADYVVGAGGGQLGSLESGLVASFTSPEISALSGGLLTIAAAIAIGAGFPGFRRYRDTDTGKGAGG
ncbi:MAG TPA: MFS transporter [Trebonia sp.]